MCNQAMEKTSRINDDVLMSAQAGDAGLVRELKRNQEREDRSNLEFRRQRSLDLALSSFQGIDVTSAEAIVARAAVFERFLEHGAS